VCKAHGIAKDIGRILFKPAFFSRSFCIFLIVIFLSSCGFISGIHYRNFYGSSTLKKFASYLVR